jgi:hypothetical protein
MELALLAVAAIGVMISLFAKYAYAMARSESTTARSRSGCGAIDADDHRVDAW